MSRRIIGGPLIQDKPGRPGIVESDFCSFHLNETLSEITMWNRHDRFREREKIKESLRRDVSPARPLMHECMSIGAARSPYNREVTDRRRGTVKPARKTSSGFPCSDLAASTEQCLEGRGKSG